MTKTLSDNPDFIAPVPTIDREETKKAVDVNLKREDPRTRATKDSEEDSGTGGRRPLFQESPVSVIVFLQELMSACDESGINEGTAM